VTAQEYSRGVNPELGGEYSHITFGTRLVCSGGSLNSVRIQTQLWDRTPGQRANALARAPRVTSANLESRATKDFYDVDYYPAAQYAEIVQFVEMDAGAGRIWRCNDRAEFSFLWCTGEGTRYLSAVVGFHNFATGVETTDRPITTTGTSAAALTFDDGPSSDWTAKILDLLKSKQVKATFCVVGVMARDHPALIRRIVNEGHTLCNHSWDHKDPHLGRRSEADIRNDLTKANNAIRAAVPGARIPYFRHPYGNFTARAVKVARELEMTSLSWSVDPQDWANPGVQTIVSRVVSKTRAGSIVLMHDGASRRQQTHDALTAILDQLKQAGITLIPLP